MGPLVPGRLRRLDMGRHTCQRAGLHRQSGLTSTILPHDLDEIYHANSRPHVSLKSAFQTIHHHRLQKL